MVPKDAGKCGLGLNATEKTERGIANLALDTAVGLYRHLFTFLSYGGTSARALSKFHFLGVSDENLDDNVARSAVPCSWSEKLP